MKYVLIYTTGSYDLFTVEKEYFNEVPEMNERINEFNKDEDFTIVFCGCYFYEYKTEDVQIVVEKKLVVKDK